MMKVIQGILTIIFLSISILSAAQRNIDVQHYRFEIGLSDQSDTIRGRATIRVKFLGPVTQFNLDLVGPAAGSGKGMKVQHIREDSLVDMTIVQNPQTITLTPGGKISAGDVRTYTIDYSGVPADGLIISKNKYRHRTFFADNWPNRGHNWLPCVDDPGDKASVEFLITAPQHYGVVSNGILVEETALPNEQKLSHWREDVPLATKVMVIGVADFAISLAGMVDGCIPVTSWVYPEDRKNGFYDYALAADILPFFIRNVGPYGYKKLANVQSKTTFGGLENASAIFYAESSIKGDRSKEDLLAHEIAHQWFGNMVTEKSFAHLWLSEGFATYMTIWYMEQKYGKDTASFMRKEDRRQVVSFAKTSNKAVVDQNSNFMELLNANSYQKGGWILHMLRRELGDSLFSKSIKAFYARYAGKNADSRDFQEVVETVSKRKLETFFSQWLLQPGMPRLEISWTYQEKEKKVRLLVRQLQKDIFQFPLEIGLTAGAGPGRTEKVQVTKATQEFLLPVREKISSLEADPNINLLFELVSLKRQ